MRTKNKILIVMVLIGISLIVSSIFMVYSEIHSAKQFCSSMNRTYSFLPDYEHRCDNMEILQLYSEFERYWDFNYNITLP